MRIKYDALTDRLVPRVIVTTTPATPTAPNVLTYHRGATEEGTLISDSTALQILDDSVNDGFGGNGEAYLPFPETEDGDGLVLYVMVSHDQNMAWTFEGDGVDLREEGTEDDKVAVLLTPGLIYQVQYKGDIYKFVYSTVKKTGVKIG